MAKSKIITTEDFETLIEILKDRTPNYKIEWDYQYDEALAKELNIGWKEYNLVYFGFNNPKYFLRHFQKVADELIFHYKKEKSFNKINNNYILALKEEIQKTLQSFQLLNARETEFHFQSDANIYIFDGDITKYTIETIQDDFFKDIVGISQAKFDIAHNLYIELNNLLDFGEPVIKDSIEVNSISKTYNKLELKLSVPEIALLLRLLDEENIFTYKFKTELFRFVTTNFSTVIQENISEASVKNKFLSPDNSAVKNIDALLVNMRQQLKKIQ